LRQYSNYLSPRLGVLSADGWTLVATFIRNLTLNWLVLIPLLMSVLMLPRICVAVLQRGHLRDLSQWDHWLMNGLLVMGLFMGAVSVAYIAHNLPNIGNANLRQKRFILFCLLPLGISVASTATFIGLYRLHRHRWDAILCEDWGTMCSVPAWGRYIGFGISVFAFGLLIFGLYYILIGRRRATQKPRVAPLLIMGFAGALASVVAGILAFQLGNNLFPLRPGDETQVEWFVCCAGPLLFLIYGIIGILIVGLTSNSGTKYDANNVTGDLEREWWSRCGAWTLIVASAWFVFGVVVLFGPLLLRDSEGGKTLVRTITGLSSFVSGLITIIGGFTSKTKGDNSSKQQQSSNITSLILNAAAIIFTVTIVAALSLLTDWLLIQVSQLFYWSNIRPEFYTNIRHDYHAALVHPSVSLVVLTCLALAALGIILGFFINTNIFSLNAVYRARLIRAYLGASNENRSPNHFTGFDPNDNLQMHEIWPGHDGPKRPERERRLLHVLNLTLNLVQGRELAWQNRKAESFTVTAKHCGNHRLGYRVSEDYGGVRGISLGTAVAISGAAVSPNMGNYSSPLVTFLMALFNVRLGWWLGNPGPCGNNTYNLPAPRWPTRSLIAETLGDTDDGHPYVYLSDGGHFENLGLYEMVLRRCRFILVVDGSADPECTFDNLGNAIQKVRIDTGVEIAFEGRLPIHARTSEKTGGRRCAIALIRYSAVDGGESKDTDGVLIYVKAAFYGDEPADVYNYARSHTDFPHESTADQWFSESQFESYRKLGLWTIESIIGDQETATLRNFISIAYEYTDKNPPLWFQSQVAAAAR